MAHKNDNIAEKTDDATTSPQTRAALMLLGRFATLVSTSTSTTHISNKQRLNVAFLRKKVLSSAAVKNENRLKKTTTETTAEDDAFLSTTSVRLDSCDIHAIENLEMLEKLTHVHLQNNFIATIEELVFCRNIQWLNLSKNNIDCIQGVAHLPQLTCLDLSSNNIHTVDNISTLLPTQSLRIFNLYNNPVCTTLSNYRQVITTDLPKLVAFDGTCLCDTPEQAPGFSPDDEIYGCDGSLCNARVIFGPRFVLTDKDTHEESDYCIACAHTMVLKYMKENDGDLDGHGYVLSTDANVQFNNQLAQDGNSRSSITNDPTSFLRQSAMNARVELRNQRDQILQKIRQRRLKTSIEATKRLDLLKRLDQHLAEKEQKTSQVTDHGKKMMEQEGKTMELGDVGSSSSRK
jgi:hypothetical protein